MNRDRNIFGKIPSGEIVGHFHVPFLQIKEFEKKSFDTERASPVLSDYLLCRRKNEFCENILASYRTWMFSIWI